METVQQYANILEKFLTSNNKPLSQYSSFFLDVLKGEHRETPQGDIYEFLHTAALEIICELKSLSLEKKEIFQSISHALNEQGFEEVFKEQSAYRKLLWKIMSSEAFEMREKHSSGILKEADNIIETIRNKRKIEITKLNPQPLENPAKQILFTSNILLTVPLENTVQTDVPVSIMERAYDIAKNEPQRYWYDHPMPIGISPDANEMLYGLHGLSDMLAYEKKAGHVPDDSTIQVVLSVSVTHTGLSNIAQEYLQFELDRAGSFAGLDVYIITENDTKEISTLLNSVLGTNDIESVFGVDGRYGRHYSFLKAILPLWNISMNKEIKATFKVDLDQVFPQEVLQQETGLSALEHFKAPLWGASAKDNEGNDIELGMIAGALVNESDIEKGLFTPDVALPQEPLGAMDILFPRGLMMALSTRAEMMTRYNSTLGEGHIDGEQYALQRVHVTGGTNGILLGALKKHRPFTPSFIGRAEDQAYLMSVYNNEGTKLRYVHASGLIMRHDKAAFAGEAIKAAKLGTYVGDLLRTILFSHYASILPGGLEAFKHLFSPFTSCFSTDIPILVTISRLLLHCTEIDESLEEIQLQIAANTLLQEIHAPQVVQKIEDQYKKEKQAWDNFYDSVEKIEKNIVQYEHIISEMKDCLQKCHLNHGEVH